LADGSEPLLATFRFLAFAASAILGPGIALQRLCRVRWDPALVLPLGLLACACAYWLSLVLGVPLLFPALVLGLDLLLLPLGVRGRRAEGPSLRGALPPILLLLTLLALTVYRTNRMAPDGGFEVDLGDRVDTSVHVGITWELVAGYPPQVPGFAGVALRYHVGSHLVRAAAARWAGIHPFDSFSRFDLTLWAIALVLALRAAARALNLRPGVVSLAGFLPLASDLSFVPGLLSTAQFWALKLGGNFVEPLFYANSISPAFAMVLAGLVALGRVEAGEGRGWLGLAAGLGAGAGFFKVFAGAQLLLALGVAWLLQRGRLHLAAVAAVVLVSLVALSAGTVLQPGSAGVTAAIVPLGPTNSSRLAFGWPAVHGPVLVASGLAWLVLSLGLRAIGVPGAWRALRRGDGVSAVLGAFALVGWPLVLLVSIRADPASDENLYFIQGSGLALWLFAAPVMLRLALRSLVAAGALALLCLPATAEFVAHVAVQVPAVIPAAAVRAMAALQEATCPGDVGLVRPGVPTVPLPVVLAGRRVAFADYVPYWRQFVTPEALAERSELVRSFFRTRDPAVAERIGRELEARYVYLAGQPRLWLETAGVLVPLFHEGRHHVYRFAWAPPRSCPWPLASASRLRVR
jgi:hypothetical protein